MYKNRLVWRKLRSVIMALLQINYILCFSISLYFCDIVPNQILRETNLVTYPHQYLRNNYHHRILPNGQIQNGNPIQRLTQKEAQDRHLHWVKFLKKKKKKSYKFFKKHFKKCLPFKFKLFKRMDGDLDTLMIKLPYGFADEYFPAQAERKGTHGLTETGANDEDDDDEDDEHIENDIKPTTTQNQDTNLVPPLYHPTRFPFLIPPFKPLRLGPKIQRRPWIQATPWRVVKSEIPSGSFNLKEPLPGVFKGSPPARPPISKLNQSNSLNRTLPQNKHNNSSGSTQEVRYSQPDYSLYGTYQTPTSSTTLNSHNLEPVVTVTPSAMWVVNSPIYHNSTPQSRNIVYSEKVWMPLSSSKNTKANKFQIIVNEDNGKPTIITKDNMNALSSDKRNVEFNIGHANGGIVSGYNNNYTNMSRIRRSQIESFAALVSGTISVKD